MIDLADQSVVRVEVRFKNAKLYNAIQNAAVPTRFGRPDVAFRYGSRMRGFCESYNLSYGMVMALVTLRKGPFLSRFHRRFVYRSLCHTLAEILCIPVGELFPPDLYRAQWPTGVAFELPVQRFIPLAEAPRSALLLTAHQEDGVASQELRQVIMRKLGTLPPQEARVINARYGLDEKGELEYGEIAAELGVDEKRVRQIEAKGLRMMRHPSRTKDLRPFLEV